MQADSNGLKQMFLCIMRKNVFTESPESNQLHCRMRGIVSSVLMVTAPKNWCILNPQQNLHISTDREK